jgi:hypothetical protein
MMTLEEAALQLVHHNLTEMACPFFDSSPQLAAQKVIVFCIDIAVNWHPTVVS